MTKRTCIFFLMVFAAGIVQADPGLKNILITTAFEAGWRSMDFSEATGKNYSGVILESDSGLLSIFNFKSPGDATAHLNQATGAPSTFRNHPSKHVGLDDISYTITWQSGTYVYTAASVKNVKQIASIFYMGLDTAGLLVSPDITDPSTISRVVNVEPVADSHVYSYTYRNWDKSNLGRYENLGAGWHPQGGEKRTFLKFNLTGLNANSFSSARLKLFHYHTGGGNNRLSLGVYAITKPWQEGTDTYHSGREEKTAAPGEISWVNQPLFNFDPIAQFNPGPGTNKFIEVDITSLVMAWLTGKPNYGLMIKPVGHLSGRVPETQYGFRSREFEDPEKRPLLVLSDSGTGIGTGTGTTNKVTDQSAVYLGCYIDKPDRDITGHYFESSEMTTQVCVNVCKAEGFSFAATQFSKHCLCGNSYGRYEKVNADECNYKCTGNEAQKCGGYWRNSVYGIDAVQINKPAKKNLVDDPKKDPSASSSGGTARLVTVSSDRDIVGSNEAFRGNGKADALFRAQFSAPNRLVTAVEVSNTNGVRSVWETRPNNGLWLGGVVIGGQIMNRSDGSVSFSLGSGQNTLDFFVEDNGSIRGGKTNYRMTIFFASGDPLVMDIIRFVKQ